MKYKGSTASGAAGLRRRLRHDRRGSALLFGTLLLMVLTVVGMTLASGALQSLRIARIQQNTSIAFNLAESGAERGVLYLRSQSAPPATTSAFDPFGGAITLGTGTYQVSIDPDDTNPSVINKRFKVRSVGRSGNRQETVEVYLQLGNFGRYAYFTDYETSSVSSGVISFKAGDVIDGPAHSNNTSSSEFNINWNNSTSSIFKEMLTSVDPTIIYAPRSPGSETEWQRVYGAGSRGFRTGVTRVELPDTTDVQRNAAWGAASGFPSTDGLFVNGSTPDHGLYIRGDATLSFAVTSQGWQTITVVQGTNTWVVTIKLDTNQTVVTKGSSTTTYAGTTNGVIYSTGNITSLTGQFADSLMSGSTLVRRNAYTIATDVANGKNITVTNNVTYRTPPDRTQAWDAAINLRSAALGLVARNVIVASNAPTDLSIHGVVLAGGRNTTDGSFYVTNYSSKTPTGDLHLLGGVIQKKRGPVGTFNSTAGTLSTGYDKDYKYDERMAVNPPPYFPTTGTYERLSFRRVTGGFGS
ncbi:MAG: hypothetical protein K0Q72_4435 [Armatimonadetes bacterium]|jgi:hypothetical protein|nr:hypothetical protein [Armatimonadota bacterium]